VVIFNSYNLRVKPGQQYIVLNFIGDSFLRSVNIVSLAMDRKFQDPSKFKARFPFLTHVIPYLAPVGMWKLNILQYVLFEVVQVLDIDMIIYAL
jgi:hypothetical protein